MMNGGTLLRFWQQRLIFRHMNLEAKILPFIPMAVGE
jgi:hypothetical protein